MSSRTASSSSDLRAGVTGPVRHLAMILGDQLDPQRPALASLDPGRDAVLMVEVEDEATHVTSHRQRTALFLTAMRHHALELMQRGWRVRYVRLDDRSNTGTFTGEAERAVRLLRADTLRLVMPSEHRVLRRVAEWPSRCGVPVDILPDPHFLTPIDAFWEWATARSQLVMEHFYRWQRTRLDILIGKDGKPHGGRWNFDTQNRKAFRTSPPPVECRRFRPDQVTNDVLRLVGRTFPNAPGHLDDFGWPVTRRQSRAALRDFITHRLPTFGPYQDAMWRGEPFLFHSLLSPAMNLKLLRPREVVDAALHALASGHAELPSVEGFVRQIVGWREFIRGVYWTRGVGYGEHNALDEHGKLPAFYWTGETDMACLSESIGQVLRYGYGHHIQRLMVTGNFALTAGIHPRAISDWYLGMYVDAVDWVTLPNTLGMVMHADGGIVGTKPYAATGKYIQRMSNYCDGCRYDPAKRHGAEACPFTTFYWDFLVRHRSRFAKNPRMALALTHVERMRPSQRRTIRSQADARRREFGIS